MRQWPKQKKMHRYPVSPTGVLQVFYDFFKFFCKVVPDTFLKNLFLFFYIKLSQTNPFHTTHSKSCFIYGFFFQVISERTLCSKDFTS